MPVKHLPELYKPLSRYGRRMGRGIGRCRTIGLTPGTGPAL